MMLQLSFVSRCGRGPVGLDGLRRRLVHLLRLERLGKFGYFAIDVTILGKRTSRATIPVACVAYVAFDHVHDAVRPATEFRLVLLHDRMRLLPFALFQMTDCSSQRHRFPR